ncbi:Cof-type HAD-IIB family hydrolase [Paenibacillus mendelii]|uniref:Cof-type HAD-IIB family hydrolase n=1 Tax=Paenibacillus mendelii TaxID=206163 RepID=A0ABV6JB41_9BACL|nr:Cof-type HAD-IIB family hydrolase [Paenibacillus mendelii]MCQ6563001.1 Cof-type HAD-IIB family hydrolase [Paenibacillus mendelii]
MGLNYDIIALDVDGTLLTDAHVLMTETRDAVREAAHLGAEIVLCTGRGPMNTIPVLEELGLSGTIITHNGAATIDAESRKVLHQYEINIAELERFMMFCREGRHHFDVNTAFELLVEGQLSTEVAAMYSGYKITPILRDISLPLPADLVKFTVFGEKEAMDSVEMAWNGWTHGLQHIRSGDFFIDVQHPEASKGDALKQLAMLRGVNPSRVMAIGNYFNDVGMLTFAGLGVAVANSPDGVKAAAKELTLSNEENGVAHALRSYAW